MRELFRAEYVNIKPATGNLAVMALVTGLAKPGDRVMKVGDNHGGYPIRLAEWAGVDIVPFPFDFPHLNIRAGDAVDLVRKVRPRLVIFGASEFLFPHPVGEIAEAAHEVGAIVAYDGSHVMGLIAGGQFQDPLREGADILFGSTHKTFPGPQRGMIATDSESLMECINRVLAPPPFLLSCFHLNTAVALGVTAAEMLAYGHEYAQQIVRNSKTLAEELVEEGVPVFAEENGYTETHQVILENGGFLSPEGQQIKERMERCGIIADAVVRIGTQEVTRLGMKESEMVEIARLVADAIHRRRQDSEIQHDVAGLAARFQRVRYAFDEEDECYAFVQG
jgi:glycine hydroxymethyltransferase